MRKLKVCHVCAAVEGAAWMVDQLRELRDRFGHDVYAIVVSDDCDFAIRLRAAGIKCFAVPFVYHSIGEMARLPLVFHRMARIIKRERFDVVQSHLFSSMLAARFAAWLADTPVRLAMIASPFHMEARISRYIDRSTAWMETGIIASCRKTVDLYRDAGVPQKKLSLIYYGPDDRRFDPASTTPANIREEYGWSVDTPVVTLVAYFYPELPKNGWIPENAWARAIKGHENFIDAAERVLREMPQVKFLLVGRGFSDAGNDYRDKIVDLVRSKGLQDDVIFTGHRTDVNEILLDSDIAIQCPVVENLGGTVEALLMQRPLIGTRVGGIPDAVRDGETGILVEPDDPAALANAILRLLHDPADAARMAANGRALMLENFTLTRAVEKMDRLYQTQFDKRRGYRPTTALARRVKVLPVYAYLGYRALFVEYIVRTYLPIYRAQARGIGYTIYYRLLGASYLLRGTVQTLVYRSIAAVSRTLAFTSSGVQAAKKKIKGTSRS